MFNIHTKPPSPSGRGDRRRRHVAETCLSNYEISQFLPSVQASAAIQVALSLVPVPSLQANTWQTLLYTLYTEAEKGDARICSSLMTRYMTPFLEAITSDLGSGHETPPSTLPFSPHDDRMDAHERMDGCDKTDDRDNMDTHDRADAHDRMEGRDKMDTQGPKDAHEDMGDRSRIDAHED
ncbi:hypothetical protein C7M84_005049 [Penaeus vannamei]|uniref:Cyclin C-terminal domain-containing protein n=1 Tax=Penaeus vannamei TaxID=6689 RepID=A0A423TIR3_PENVA|nr:hypothetical protein C7M84_005049 [Penaeus vannamei]